MDALVESEPCDIEGIVMDGIHGPHVLHSCNIRHICLVVSTQTNYQVNLRAAVHCLSRSDSSSPVQLFEDIVRRHIVDIAEPAENQALGHQFSLGLAH